MTSKHTKGKVRDFELTLEDAGRLADCLNSFDDSDSWPGGFTHGNPFTAERVLKSWKKQDNLRVIVAFKDDKIVGHCNVVQGELDPEAAYVGLLGADPAYQGQGFGKAMLIEAAETAANAGKRRIDLHTWAGNLKAMPLYKKVGYNWVPGTRVLMESHIPGILSCEMFEEFFSRYHWYDAYKRVIHQEVDDVMEGALGVFKYIFEGENGDSLEVTVDREAKGICGFKLALDGRALEVDIRSKSHHGYIGTGETPVELAISNKRDKDLSYSVQVAPTKGFSVDVHDKTSGSVTAGDEAILKAIYSIGAEAEPLNRATNPDEKAKTQAEWFLRIGEQSIHMFNGLVSREAVTVSSGPHYPSISPGESAKLAIALRNNSEQAVKGVAAFASPNEHKLSMSEHSFSLNPDETTEVYLDFSTTSDDENKIVPVEISVSVEQEGHLALIAKKPLDIPVIGPVGALAYRSLNEELVLETETIRVTMARNPPMMIRRMENKITGKSERVWWFLPMPGYPFPSEGGEWANKKFNVQVRNLKDRAEIQLEADSTDRPGLRMTVIYRVYPGREYVEAVVRFTNVGTTKQTNLGLMLGLWMDYLGARLFVPVNGSIHSLDSVEWTGDRQLPKSPKHYHESWAAKQDYDGVTILGAIWDPEFLDEVIPTRRRSMIRTEYRLPDLEVGQFIEKT
ncbi:MAG: GNAT family N-acetyltransferase, partial [Candidatus Thorarchaeota archaeon]